MKYRFDEKNNFITAFDNQTGFYYRSGVLDPEEQFRETDQEPFMADFPHLIDIGIMGHCIHGMKRLCEEAGIQCYQNGPNRVQKNMPIEDYQTIIDQCQNKVHQVALGGRGDPDQHENFKEILHYTRQRGIVPNYTTSGLGMTKELAQISKAYCGAVAVSWYRSDYTLNAIAMLKAAGVKTNIHYVLSQSTIREAIERLDHHGFPQVNAIIFLLHKPVGLGQTSETLDVNDPLTQAFFDCIERNLDNYAFGFDSCTVPGLLTMTSKLDPRSFDACEGARFSCYIGPDMMLSPCSFDVNRRWLVDLHKQTIEEGWYSKAFEDFREHLSSIRPECKSCTHHELCLGGCPIEPSIVLCDKG